MDKNTRLIPYSRQSVDESDIEAVIETLKSDWLTTGPKLEEFETAIAAYIGVKHAVAVSSGTAALHSAMYALGIGPGDEVIVPAMTFAATANCILYQAAKPVFADVQPDTLLIDPEDVKQKISDKTKAIIAVDYAGHPCEYDELKKICDKHNLALVADSCHALGARYKGVKVGALADLTTFSFHPVKHITTGEGGMIVTNEPNFSSRMKIFRNHGISNDFRQREEEETWFYEMNNIGFNYRLTDIQCAFGISQLKKLDSFLEKRNAIAQIYDEAFSKNSLIQPLKRLNHVFHAYHLYVVRIDFAKKSLDKKILFKKLREKGIGVNVHYIPVHLHPYYKRHLNTGIGLCPVSEQAYEKILSLPIHPLIENYDLQFIIDTIQDEIEH
jgi:perosamine synthetase